MNWRKCQTFSDQGYWRWSTFGSIFNVCSSRSVFFFSYYHFVLKLQITIHVDKGEIPLKQKQKEEVTVFLASHSPPPKSNAWIEHNRRGETQKEQSLPRHEHLAAQNLECVIFLVALLLSFHQRALVPVDFSTSAAKLSASSFQLDCYGFPRPEKEPPRLGQAWIC